MDLIEKDFIMLINDINSIKPGTVIRRIGSGKDQQGLFTQFDDKQGLILLNVVDMKDICFAAEAGILRPTKDDQLYEYSSGFQADIDSFNALEIIQEWPLFAKCPEFQNAIIEFIKTVYVPKQIITYKKNNMMQYVFIPVQQKFKIGRFVETIDWNKYRVDKFREYLNDLQDGEHMTYIALVPQIKTYTPMFYSIGTKPHQTTHHSLKSEAFNFKPTHGGHIKAAGVKNGVKQLLVDAGSNYIGKGVNSPISIAKDVAKAMKKIYKDFDFIAVEGRSAYGTEQSY